jgi:hypothetical protein
MACRAKAAHGIEHRIEHAEEHEAEVILFEQQALRAAGPLFGLGRHLRADPRKPGAEIVQQFPAPELRFVDLFLGAAHIRRKSETI